MALVRKQNLRSSPTSGWDLSNTGTFGNIFQEFDQFFNEITPRFYQGAAVQGYPVDLYETGEALVLEMAVPGVSVDDIDISIEGRQLSVRGSLPHAEEGEARRYWLQSIPRGQFHRTITLPTTVEVDNVEAKVNGGLLTLTMPKVDEARARRITVQQG